MTMDTGRLSPSERPSAIKDYVAFDQLYVLEPDEAPLMSLILGRYSGGEALNQEVSDSMTFDWTENERAPVWDQINYGAGYPVGNETDLVVDNAAYFVANDMVKCHRTGELMRVTVVTTGTNTLTVVRGVGNSGTGVALVDGDYLHRVGTSFEDGSGIGTIRTLREVAKSGYCQIHKTPLGVTYVDLKTKYRSGSAVQNLRRMKAMEHKVGLEYIGFFGKKDTDTGSGGKLMYFSDGLFNVVSTNDTISVGTLTELKWLTFLQTGMRYGSRSKVFFCGPTVANAFDSWGLDKIRIAPKEKTYGVTMYEYHSRYGVVYIAYHKLFEQDSALTGSGILVDIKNVKMRYLRDSNTKLRMNIQAPDVLAQDDEYLTIAGFQVIQEKSHAKMSGVTG